MKFTAQNILAAFANLFKIDDTASLVHVRNTPKEGGGFTSKITRIRHVFTFDTDDKILFQPFDRSEPQHLEADDKIYLTTTNFEEKIGDTEDFFRSTELFFNYLGAQEFEGAVPQMARYEFIPEQDYAFRKKLVRPAPTYPGIDKGNENLSKLTTAVGGFVDQLKEGFSLRTTLFKDVKTDKELTGYLVDVIPYNNVNVDMETGELRFTQEGQSDWLLVEGDYLYIYTEDITSGERAVMARFMYTNEDFVPVA